MTAANDPANRSTACSRSIPALVVYAEGIVKCMTGNPAFPNPAPALAQVTGSPSSGRWRSAGARP